MKERVWHIIDEVMIDIQKDQDFKGSITLMAMAIEKTIERCARIAETCIEEEWYDVGGAIREHFEDRE